MPNTNHTSCTAFDHARRIASGPYLIVALSLKSYARVHPGGA